MGRRLKKYSNRKKKRMKRCSQENYQGGLWLKHYRNGQIKSMRGKGRKDRKRTGGDGKIP